MANDSGLTILASESPAPLYPTGRETIRVPFGMESIDAIESIESIEASECQSAQLVSYG